MSFAPSILLGLIVRQVLNAEQASLEMTELVKTDVVGIEGKEIIMQLMEFAIVGFSP